MVTLPGVCVPETAIYHDILTADYLLVMPGIDVFSLTTVRYGIETPLWIIFDKPR